ncbi:MAG: spermidine synthase, partial [Phycisphaerales bacterium]
MRWVFALATFLGAALIFLVEPMLGKALLPRLGGGPAVWNTCLVFFQAALLAGYAVAHLIGQLRSVRVQAVIFGAMALGSWLLRPGSGPSAIEAVDAAAPLLSTGRFLLLTIGLPFVTLAAAGPLLQRWFTVRTGASPYVLYAVSNAGSLVGLLAYPFAVERQLRLPDQFVLWGVALAVFAVVALLAGSLAGSAFQGPQTEPPVQTKASWGTRFRWLALSAVPSSMLMGTTTHLSSDVASMPLLWMPPLAIYLVTFMVAFAERGGWLVIIARWGLPVMAIGAGALAISDLRSPLWAIVALHLALLLVAGTACHGLLYSARPKATGGTDLTGFYLTIALGGVIGGCWNALAAPLIFTDVVEYPLAIVAALALAGPRTPWPLPRLARIGLDAFPALGAVAVLMLSERLFDGGWAGDGHTRFLVVAIVPAAIGLLTCWVRFGTLLLVITLLGWRVVMPAAGPGVGLIHAERSFFGIHRVFESGSGETAARELWHGRIVHGMQFIHPPLNAIPTSYYLRGGPISDVFVTMYERDGAEGPAPLRRAGFIGLGSGTLCSFTRSSVAVDFYEIDPAVVRIAQDPALFTYVERSRAKPAFIIGDARVRLAERARATPPVEPYGLLLVDAFSGDSIPVHLLTKEAFELYLHHLADDGLLAVHISNKYLDLEPVIAAAAESLGLVAHVRNDTEISAVQLRLGKATSKVAVLARDARALGTLTEREG